jgi:hypothetical protein
MMLYYVYERQWYKNLSPNWIFSEATGHLSNVTDMSQAPSEVYVRQLLPKKYGYPLFIPAPHNNLPREYRNRGTSIGDVGIIKPNGSFSFVFSICTPAGSPVNCFGVPQGFEPLVLGPEGIEVVDDRHSVGSDVVSTSITRKEIAAEIAVKENKYECHVV